MLTARTSARPQDLQGEDMPRLADDSFHAGCLLLPFGHVQSSTCKLHHATTENPQCHGCAGRRNGCDLVSLYEVGQNHCGYEQ